MMTACAVQCAVFVGREVEQGTSVMGSGTREVGASPVRPRSRVVGRRASRTAPLIK